MLILLTLVLAGQPATEFPALKQRLQRGNYAEARAGYEALLKDKNPAGGAFVGLALCFEPRVDIPTPWRPSMPGSSLTPTTPPCSPSAPTCSSSWASGRTPPRTRRLQSRSRMRTSSRAGFASDCFATRATSPRPTRRSAGS